MRVSGCTCAVAVRWFVALSLALGSMTSAQAATIFVAAGDDLQAVLDAAQPGDTILLQEGAEFVGTFVLPPKPDGPPITLRSSASDSMLPRAGQRITPGHAPLLALLRSGTTSPALRTSPGAANWKVQYLEFSANTKGYGDLIQLGDGSSAQNTLDSVPRHLVLQHLYVHGDPAVGQKRCIALNASDVTIRDSYIAECKTVGQDSQAIGGWNGPGPYVIENNYIEGAGENFMLGGSDPAILNLVADGITFRRNHVARPMSWQSPIIPQPTGVTAVSGSGGALSAGTYAYRVVARRPVGQAAIGRSSASVEVAATVAAAGGTVAIEWQPVPLATEYRVYGRVRGGQTMFWTVTNTSFVDDGRAGVSEKVPTSMGTRWLVKNLFELKSARNVVVEENIFENHWPDGQPGYAIVFTPRNSGETCTWCVVEHVRFERNIVRNVAAVFNLLGYDSPEVTEQTKDITIQNNLFYGVRKSLGGNAWFALIGDEPRDLTIDHNTIDADGTTLVYVYGGSATAPRAVEGFTMTNNAARHGSYGMAGSNFAYGNAILTSYFPGAVFTRNYLAGGPASRYPVGNLFTPLFEDQFVDVAAGDYTVRPGSLLDGAATDGTDTGANFAEIADGVHGVIEGRSEGNLPPVAAFTETCTDLTCTITDASTDAEGAISTWTWGFGDGETSSGAQCAHTFAAAGTYVVTLTVTDAEGLTATESHSVTVTAPNVPPSAALTSACDGLTCTFTDTSVDVDGTIVARRWSFGDGGTGSASSEVHRFATPGTYPVSVEIADDRGGAATAEASVTVGRSVHVADLTGAITTWRTYWSTEMVLTLHDQDENPIAGAAVAFQWSGAVAKLASCVTDASGQCTLNSGTLAAKRPSVTLTVTSISAPDSTYAPAANHSVPGTGASLTVELPVVAPPVTPAVHVSGLTGAITTWRTYWSTAMVVTVHDETEQPLAGATVVAAWTGAVVKSGSCVTDAAGQCAMQSGTLSGKRPSVTLSVTDVVASGRIYEVSANHDVAGPGAAITLSLEGESEPTPVPTAAAAAHVGGLTGEITTWSSYWSTAMQVTVHDENDNPLAGATVSASWTEAVVKLASCVTDAAGQCTLKSGTLSGKRPSVSLTITDVAAPSRAYDAGANHGVGAIAAITLTKPI
jgi:PKD repeat protein